jgi:hypothetical protein
MLGATFRGANRKFNTVFPRKPMNFLWRVGVAGMHHISQDTAPSHADCARLPSIRFPRGILWGIGAIAGWRWDRCGHSLKHADGSPDVFEATR